MPKLLFEDRGPVELSDMRCDICMYIDAYFGEYGYMPSYREIARAVGLKSIASVHSHMQALVKLDIIATSHPGSPRAFRLIHRLKEEDEEIN